MKIALTLAALLSSFVVQATCDIRISSIEPCDAQGNPVTVTMGQHVTWGVRVSGNIKGTPTGDLFIRVWMGNRSGGILITNPGPGPFVRYRAWSNPTDEPMPCFVEADPSHTAGDTDYSNNNASMTVTAVPPATAIDYYEPVNWRCIRTATYRYSGLGTSDWYSVWGLPSDLGYQTIVRHQSPPDAQFEVSRPCGDPVLILRRGELVPETNHVIELSSDLTAYNVRCNANLLRQVTWAAELRPTMDAASYLPPDQFVNWNTPAVEQFVDDMLPSDFRASMTPYDVARTLFKGTIARVTYGAQNWNAVDVLNSGHGDCGGFSFVFAAGCRAVGIPARCVGGFSSAGPNAWHMWAEFWLAGYGWVPVDAQASDALDWSGTYSYWFGYCPQQNTRVGVSPATSHMVNGMPMGSGYDYGFLQVPYSCVSFTDPNSVHDVTVTWDHRLVPR